MCGRGFTSESRAHTAAVNLNETFREFVILSQLRSCAITHDSVTRACEMGLKSL